MSEAALGLVVPGMPHVLLAADQNAGYARLKDAFAEARRRIELLRKTFEESGRRITENVDFDVPVVTS